MFRGVVVGVFVFFLCLKSFGGGETEPFFYLPPSS